MQIKIEIDVKPEELRRFLGLPDVAGLQEDLVQFLREKLGAASETFDPTSFVKDNLQSLRESTAWRKIVSAAKAKTSQSPAAPAQKTSGQRRTKTDAAASMATGKAGSKKASVRKRKAAGGTSD